MPLGRNTSFGRAYRAYRFPHKRGGRLSRRYSPASKLGAVAGALSAMLIVFAIFAGAAAAAFFGYFAADLPAAHDLATVPVPLSTYIYDRTGEHLLYTLEEERRDLVALGEVPKLMQDATIAIEDHSFWTNPGIDVSGIVRALSTNLQRGTITQGGSTITQQLIKTRLLGDEPTITRKIKEAMLAVEVSRTFSKNQILEMYFNQIFYGNQAYGIRAAAKTYFGVADLNQLTLGQMALLAGLPQAPSDYDPVQDQAAAAARRAQVLDAMLDQGYITEDQAVSAKAEKIAVTPAKTSLYAPHFTFRAREQLIQTLGERAAYRGGYRVYTTLDWNMQQLAEKEVREHVDGLRFANVRNAALITMDPTTGEILAYVGSKDYYDRSPQVQGDYDVAGIGLRQPGSTFKLFTYLTGFLKARMTPSTILNDIEFEMPGGDGKTYHPHDAPGGDGKSQQHGPTTVRQALRESLNLPALNVTRMVGVDAIIDTVHQLGITRDWDRSRLGLSFGIGAGEMRLIDMASAYQVVANYGRRIEPTFISKIVDRDGKVVRDYQKPEQKQVIDERVAWLMTDILKDNTDPVHGSFVFGPFTNIGRPAALKTGTTDNLQDVLAIGYTPTRLTAIWMGNSDNSEMNGISSALGPGILWRDYMKTVVGGLPPDDFKRPGGIVDKVVCVNPSLTGGNGSGKLPGPYCPASYRWTEHFVQGTEPVSDDRDVYQSCGYRLTAPFADWQKDIDKWAREAVS
ncbi:MAG TPA: transglycosylase domain-containing protein, partial [Candidatus Limnocylindria bacterium]